MPLDSYSALSAAIGSWEERAFTSADTDEFILLTESKANRRLARHWARQATETITTDASGYATLPTGFLGLVSLKQDLLGTRPMTQVSWDMIDMINPNADANRALYYAISGTELRVAPVCEDDFIATFDKQVVALSSTNATNWLLALAPDYYLFGGQAAAAAKFKAYQEAAMLQAQADGILDELVNQANVAQLGNAELIMSGVTP
jgi:hypothetical protein